VDEESRTQRLVIQESFISLLIFSLIDTTMKYAY